MLTFGYAWMMPLERLREPDRYSLSTSSVRADKGLVVMGVGGGGGTLQISSLAFGLLFRAQELCGSRGGRPGWVRPKHMPERFRGSYQWSLDGKQH